MFRHASSNSFYYAGSWWVWQSNAWSSKAWSSTKQSIRLFFKNRIIDVALLHLKPVTEIEVVAGLWHWTKSLSLVLSSMTTEQILDCTSRPRQVDSADYPCLCVPELQFSWPTCLTWDWICGILNETESACYVEVCILFALAYLVLCKDFRGAILRLS